MRRMWSRKKSSRFFRIHAIATVSPYFTMRGMLIRMRCRSGLPAVLHLLSETLLLPLSLRSSVVCTWCFSTAATQPDRYRDLEAAGIPVVLGTATDAISDDVACGVAEYFYRSLAAGSTIERAYAEAKAYYEMDEKRGHLSMGTLHA